MNEIVDNIWTERSRDDFQSAISLMKEGIIFNAFYFMQQAVEKLLKGILYEYDINFEKIHDIQALLESIEEIDCASFTIPDVLNDNATYISQWESDTRYPDEFFDVEEDRPIYNAIEQDFLDWVDCLANYGDFF